MLGPAILLAIELFHPANFTAHPGMYQFLSHAEHGGAQFKALAYFGPDWWFTLHMIQTPLVRLVDGVVLLLNRFWTDPWVDGVGSFVSLTGSWAVFAASAFLAAALGWTRVAGWLTLLTLLGFGWELQTSHASPHGPAAFALLIIASTALWWRERRLQTTQ